MNSPTALRFANVSETGVWHLNSRHFGSVAPSRRTPDESIKPHGSRHAAPGMNKELEAYPKCL
jgi:hypothetical protein